MIGDDHRPAIGGPLRAADILIEITAGKSGDGTGRPLMDPQKLLLPHVGTKPIGTICSRKAIEPARGAPIQKPPSIPRNPAVFRGLLQITGSDGSSEGQNSLS